MKPDLGAIWVYLSASPLLWLTATLLAYAFANWIYAKTNHNAWANPVAISVAILTILLTATDTSYNRYFDGAQFIHFLLGPVTVALAIPLYQQIDKLKRNWFAFLSAALVGAAAAITTGMGVAWLLGASPVTVLSIAAKSVTIPIAMGVTEKIGGLPSLTAVLVMLTGILGAVIGQKVLRAIKVTDESVCGFALGATAHGIGTARAFQVSQEMGAFSGLAMGLSGLLTGLLLPLALKLLGVF